jgi:AhpD family alkylhydroperoxidase
MARIAGNPRPGLLTRLVYWFTRKRLGRVPEPIKIMAHNGWVLAAVGAFESLWPKATALQMRGKELVQVLVAMNVGCRFCIDIGSAIARTHGVTTEDLQELLQWQTSKRFSAVERLMFEYAEAMTHTPVKVPEPLFRALQEALGPAALVELSAAIAWENWRARFNHAFGADEEGFSEGAYCALPPRVGGTTATEGARA